MRTLKQMANNPLITFFSNLNTTNNEDPEANGNNPLITFFSNLNTTNNEDTEAKKCQ